MSGPVAVLDTNLFLNVLNREAGFEEPSAALLDAAEDGRFVGLVSTITIAELCAGFEMEEDPRAREELLSRLYSSEGFRVADVTRAVGELGGRLRARQGLRLPDALVAATGLLGGARHLVTHDTSFERLGRELPAVSAKAYLQRLGRS